MKLPLLAINSWMHDFDDTVDVNPLARGWLAQESVVMQPSRFFLRGLGCQCPGPNKHTRSEICRAHEGHRVLAKSVARHQKIPPSPVLHSWWVHCSTPTSPCCSFWQNIAIKISELIWIRTSLLLVCEDDIFLPTFLQSFITFPMLLQMPSVLGSWARFSDP